jgi:inosine-uridine nucleoside N-ribohydrolase
MERLIIDTDPGIDDAAAIFFALASPEVSVDLVTTVFGNVGVEQATINAARLLALAGRPEIPIRRGADRPWRGAARFATHVHGNDGLGDIEWPAAPPAPEAEDGAADAILAHVDRHPGEVTLVALGPPTNVALALLRAPSLAGRVKRIVCMGGAVLTMGNASPVASANFHNDPWATAIVYESGAPIVQIGLDVCGKVYVTDEQMDRIASGGGTPGRALREMSRFIRAAYQRVPAPVRRWSPYGAGPWVHFNDVPAIGYAVMPRLFTGERLPVVVETEGLCRGQTVADFRGHLGREPNVEVCLDVDGGRLAQIFVERLARPGDPERSRA